MLAAVARSDQLWRQVLQMSGKNRRADSRSSMLSIESVVCATDNSACFDDPCFSRHSRFEYNIIPQVRASFEYCRKH